MTELLDEIPTIPKHLLPKCDKCGTNDFVEYLGPDTMGSEFVCTKCDSHWAQEV